MSIPPSVGSGTITGVTLRTSDGSPVAGVQFIFTPALQPGLVTVAGSVPPVVIAVDPVVGVTNAAGVLCGPDGVPGVVLTASSDVDVSPSGWTWVVTTPGTSSWPSTAASFVLAPGEVKDLTTITTLSPSLGVEIAAWTAAIAAVTVLRDQAAAAAAGAVAGKIDTTAVDAKVAGDIANANSLTRAALRQALARVPALRQGIFPTRVNRTMTAPPTVGAVATASGIAGGITHPVNVQIDGVTSNNLNRARFAFFANNVSSIASTFPDYFYSTARYLTDPVSGNGGPGALATIADGTQVEFITKGAGQQLFIKVDGEYTSATPITLPNDGAMYWIPITFAVAAPRLLQFELDKFIVGFVRVGPAATLVAPVSPEPSLMVIGDSFSEAGGGGYSTRPWWRTFANALGLPNAQSASLGGTGYLAVGPSNRPTIRPRLVTDVYPYAPDILVIAAGINDTSFTQAAIEAEVLAVIAAVRGNLPGTALVIVDTFAGGGVENDASIWKVHKAIKAACNAQSVPFLSTVSRPRAVVTTTTLTASALAGATTISLGSPVAARDVIDLDTERRVVTAITGTGPFVATVVALSFAHASGKTVSTVGAPLLTGTGQVGTPTGVGSSDLLVGPDGTHPSQAGSNLIGLDLAAQFIALT